jgi:2-polyprenyl-3-methyl-5-hydroxy-6-metoxy-1,4-benzoquinol methylase
VVIVERIARQYSSPWLRCYARGKLWRDPVFAAAFDLLQHSALPVLDVGCGVGLFEFYLRERGFLPPLFGVDFDTGKIARAQRIAGRSYRDITFTVGDVLAIGDFRGHVVLFDVLHYLPAARQAALLEHLAGHVAPGGLCLIRATPREANWRFRFTQLQEFFLRASLWMKSGARHYGSVDEIIGPFRARGFACEVRPLWDGTPFNSHFFVFRAPG